MNYKGDCLYLSLTAAAIVETKSGEKGDAVTGGATELFHSIGMVARFTEDVAIQYCYLIRANNQAVGVVRRDCLGLLLSEAGD